MIYINLDVSPLEQFVDNFSAAVRKSLQKTVAGLAAATHAHIIEEANKQLHSTRDLFIENIQRFKDEDGTWIIVLDSSVTWIDDGLKSQDMLPYFLKSSKAKTAKDGHKYMVIPFELNKQKSKSTASQRDLLSAIKSELSSIGVNLNKTETDSSGVPKLGLVRSLDIATKPIKSSQGPGQGQRAIGDVRQGATGTPFLKGVRVYQHMAKDKRGNDKVQKSVVTFRTASENRKSPNSWHTPGVEGKHLFENASNWALREFDNKILPTLIAEIKDNT